MMKHLFTILFVTLAVLFVILAVQTSMPCRFLQAAILATIAVAIYFYSKPQKCSNQSDHKGNIKPIKK